MKRILISLLAVHCVAMGTHAAQGPSTQAFCIAMLKIIGWNDLPESANATNADRVRGAGLIRILGAQLAEEIDAKNEAQYQYFFPPEPGQPHDTEITLPPSKEVAAVSTDPTSRKPVADRLARLLYDARYNWEHTRYFFQPYDPLMVAELSSMWQRHARNEALSEESNEFGGDAVLSKVNNAVEKGLHNGQPVWAHIGFEATVEGLAEDGTLALPNAGPGYASEYPKGTPVSVDYILLFDPTDPSKPSGMTVVLRFPSESSNRIED